MLAAPVLRFKTKSINCPATAVLPRLYDDLLEFKLCALRLAEIWSCKKAEYLYIVGSIYKGNMNEVALAALENVKESFLPFLESFHSVYGCRFKWISN